MGSLISGGLWSLAAITTAYLLAMSDLTTLSPIFFTPLILAIGYFGLRILQALISPYISPLRHIRGPKNNQFPFGQALNIFRSPGPNDLYIKWMKTWPSEHFIRHLSFGNSEVLLVNSLEAHKEVLQTKAYSLVKPKVFERLIGELVGKGVLFSVGAEHRHQRRFLAGPFSTPNIRGLLPVFQDKARDLSSYIEREIGSKDNEVVEIESAFIKTTLDIIGVTFLGVELEKLKPTSISSTLNLEECWHYLLEPSFLEFLITFINAFVPIRWLPIPANWKFHRAINAIWSTVTELTEKRFQEEEARRSLQLIRKEGEGRDLLTYMTEANLTSPEEALTRRQIIEDILQFIIAGYETSAMSLTWTTYALAMNPSIQDRLRQEILSVTKIGTPDYAAIENMHFLNNVLRESLRLYSPGLTLPREAGEDLVIAGVHIPKGTTLTMIPAMVQRNPLIWGEDADEFNPDRWDNLNAEAASPYAMTSFSGGPRVCLGRSFAYLEMKVVLVELLSKFILEPVDKNPKTLNPAVTLKPKGGLKVKLRRVP